MPETVLEARNITVGYGQIPAVRDVSLSLAEGEVLALLGPNGAGKTTTLLSLVGLLATTQGTISALGRDVVPGGTARLARAGAVLVPDDRGIFADLTVAEHFRLAAGRRSRHRRDLVLDRFEALRALERRQAGLLSGGEQQMLALAKALLSRPRLLMVDEMSLGLAPIIVKQLLPGIRDLAKEEGIAVLLVEQHIAIALSVADRAVVLNHGRVVLEDAAATLLADPVRVESAYFTSRADDLARPSMTATSREK